MRVPSYEQGTRRSPRAFVRLTRALGAELDDVGKAAMRRPEFFGKPFLGFAHLVLRGPSAWSVGERELFAAVVSRANACQFCVGSHGEIAAKELGGDGLARLDEGRLSPRAAAAATFVEALPEAIYVAFLFNTINRVVSGLGFEHRSDRDRRRGAGILRPWLPPPRLP